MKKSIRYVGLDVHAETISVAVAEEDGKVLSLGRFPNMPQYVAKLVKKLRPCKTITGAFLCST